MGVWSYSKGSKRLGCQESRAPEIDTEKETSDRNRNRNRNTCIAFLYLPLLVRCFFRCRFPTHCLASFLSAPSRFAARPNPLLQNPHTPQFSQTQTPANTPIPIHTTRTKTEPLLPPMPTTQSTNHELIRLLRLLDRPARTRPRDPRRRRRALRRLLLAAFPPHCALRGLVVVDHLAFLWGGVEWTVFI